MVRVRIRPLEDLVASVRAANSDEEIVFSREVRGNMALTFATVSSPDENIDESILETAVEAEMAPRAGENVGLRAPLGVDNNVRDVLQFADVTLGAVTADLCIRRKLSYGPSPRSVPSC
jgi:hypothetical protein